MAAAVAPFACGSGKMPKMSLSLSCHMTTMTSTGPRSLAQLQAQQHPSRSYYCGKRPYTNLPFCITLPCLTVVAVATKLTLAQAPLVGGLNG